METTAVYDPATDELIVNTPTPLAQKYWITNGACHAKHIVVFAQLWVKGKNEGIHGVLVRCRGDELEPIEGVTVEDMGHKMGLNGVDNAKLTFDNVRVPRVNLLNKFSDITPEGHLVPHVLYGDPLYGLQLIPPAPHQHAMDPLILALNPQLGEYHNVLGMTRTVGDPVLLCQGSGCVHDKLVGGRVVNCGRLHFYSVVAVAKLCEAKAANILHTVNPREKVVVPFSAQSEHGSPKQVELHGHFCSHGWVDDCQLVSCEDSQRVVDKVEN